MPAADARWRETMKYAPWSTGDRGDMLVSNVIPTLPPGVPAVYVWRRAVPRNPNVIESGESLGRWIANGMAGGFMKAARLVLARPSVDADLAVRRDFLRVDGLQIGGGRLSRDKLASLQAISSSPSDRLATFRIVQDGVERFGPILYVGQTECLRQRLTDHACGTSPLTSRLGDLGLELGDTIVYYLPMVQSSQAEREMIEQILTHILVAPLTYRPG